nr:MAG TPA: hypothetical protein [Caudoviricetes sp.]
MQKSHPSTCINPKTLLLLLRPTSNGWFFI